MGSSCYILTQENCIRESLGGSRMRSIFADETFAFEWLRTVGHAPYGAADIGERLAAADQIVDGDLESWHQGGARTPGRVRRGAEVSAAGGHSVSACAAYMRASNYYR